MGIFEVRFFFVPNSKEKYKVLVIQNKKLKHQDLIGLIKQKYIIHSDSINRPKYTREFNVS